MILKIKDFTNALDKVEAFTAGEKNIPGILLDIKDDSVDICYSDGRRSLIESIDAEVGDDDRKEGIVLNYNRLVDIIGACQPTGIIHTDELEIIFESNNILKIRAEKKIIEEEPEIDWEDTEEVEVQADTPVNISSDVEDEVGSERDEEEPKIDWEDFEKVSADTSVDIPSDISVDDKDEEVGQEKKKETKEKYRAVSVFEQSINWIPAGGNIRVAILSRTKYSDIFEPSEPGDVDEWNIKELRDILDRTSTEKNRIVYISPKNECTFVSNLAYLSCIPIEGSYNLPMIMSTSIAKAIHEILGKIGSEKTIYIHVVDKRFICMFTEDKKLGIMVEMSDAKRMHLTTLQRYQEKEYKTYQMTFIKEVLKNVVDSAITSGETDKTVLKFKKSELEGGLIDLNISSKNAGASISNNYRVVTISYQEGIPYDECNDDIEDTSGKSIEDKSNIENLELPVSLKVLSDMLGRCNTDYVGLDVDIDSTGTKCIRVSELDFEARLNVEDEIRKRLDIEPGDSIPLNEQLECRHKILSSRHYTVSSR